MRKRHASHGSGMPGPDDLGSPAVSGGAAAREQHTPVLLRRCVELLTPALEGERPVHVDATIGLGGHAEAMLAANPTVLLVGLDRDPSALARCARRLAAYTERIRLVHAIYDELPHVLSGLNLDTVDSVLFDLGVSSMQLDDPGRGFAYAQDAPLDMRMDPTTGRTAEEIVNDYPAAELARVLRVYGEERFARRIAEALVRERAKARITSSARLAELVRQAIPAPARRTGGHPAKRTFQALRIEVNGELAALEAALPAAIDALAIGGRIAVLSYHSLEDRMVKQTFAQRARSTGPVDLPVELAGHGPSLRLLTRGAEVPDQAEILANPRAASARLRAGERVDPDTPQQRPGARMRASAAMRQPAVRGVPRRKPTHTQGGTMHERGEDR